MTSWRRRASFSILNSASSSRATRSFSSAPCRFYPEDAVAALERQGVTFLPMTILHAARPLETPLGHRDPFDELLLVTAQEEGLRLLTIDRQLVDHPLALTLEGHA